MDCKESAEGTGEGIGEGIGEGFVVLQEEEGAGLDAACARPNESFLYRDGGLGG